MFDQARLSPAGQRRRESILKLAQAEARRRRHRRHGVAIAIGGLATIVLALVLQSPKKSPEPSSVAIGPHRGSSPAPTRSSTEPEPSPITITRLITEPNYSQRFLIPPQKPNWQLLDDDQLLQQLNSEGHPAGLAWIDGQEMVLLRQSPTAESAPSIQGGS